MPRKWLMACGFRERPEHSLDLAHSVPLLSESNPLDFLFMLSTSFTGSRLTFPGSQICRSATRKFSAATGTKDMCYGQRKS